MFLLKYYFRDGQVKISKSMMTIFSIVAVTEVSWLFVVVMKIHQSISGLADIALTENSQNSRQKSSNIERVGTSLQKYLRFTNRYIQCTLIYGECAKIKLFL